jgi:hypothetical protein
VILADWRERAAGVELEPTNPEWTGNQTRSCFAMNDPKKYCHQQTVLQRGSNRLSKT